MEMCTPGFASSSVPSISQLTIVPPAIQLLMVSMFGPTSWMVPLLPSPQLPMPRRRSCWADMGRNGLRNAAMVSCSLPYPVASH